MIMNIDFSFNIKHFASLLDRGRHHCCAGDPEVKDSTVSYDNFKRIKRTISSRFKMFIVTPGIQVLCEILWLGGSVNTVKYIDI